MVFDWYDGKNLMQVLSDLSVPKKPINKPLRIPVTNIFKIGGVGTVACGRIQSGSLVPQMELSCGVGHQRKQLIKVGSIATPHTII